MNEDIENEFPEGWFHSIGDRIIIKEDGHAGQREGLITDTFVYASFLFNTRNKAYVIDGDSTNYIFDEEVFLNMSQLKRLIVEMIEI